MMLDGWIDGLLDGDARIWREGNVVCPRIRNLAPSSVELGVPSYLFPSFDTDGVSNVQILSLVLQGGLSMRNIAPNLAIGA